MILSTIYLFCVDTEFDPSSNVFRYYARTSQLQIVACRSRTKILWLSILTMKNTRHQKIKRLTPVKKIMKTCKSRSLFVAQTLKMQHFALEIMKQILSRSTHFYLQKFMKCKKLQLPNQFSMAKIIAYN